MFKKSQSEIEYEEHMEQIALKLMDSFQTEPEKWIQKMPNSSNVIIHEEKRIRVLVEHTYSRGYNVDILVPDMVTFQGKRGYAKKLYNAVHQLIDDKKNIKKNEKAKKVLAHLNDKFEHVVEFKTDETMKQINQWARISIEHPNLYCLLEYEKKVVFLLTNEEDLLKVNLKYG